MRMEWEHKINSENSHIIREDEFFYTIQRLFAITYIFVLHNYVKKYYIQYFIAKDEQWRCRRIWKCLEWDSIRMGRDKRVYEWFLGAIMKMKGQKLEVRGSFVMFHLKSTQILNLSKVPFEVEGWDATNMGRIGFCRPLWRSRVETWRVMVPSSLSTQSLLRFRI